MPLNESRSGGERGRGREKKEAYNAVLRQYRWMGNADMSFSQGKSNPKLGVAVKGVAGEAAGRPGGSNYSTDQLSSHTYNLEHPSETSSME